MEMEKMCMKCPYCGSNIISDNSLYRCNNCYKEFYIFPKNEIDKVQVIRTEENGFRQQFKTEKELIDFNNYCRNQIAEELGMYLLDKGYLTMEKGKWDFLDNASYYKFTCLVVKPEKKR